MCLFFFFNDTATTEIYTLSLHDALPISDRRAGAAILARQGGSQRRCVRRGEAGVGEPSLSEDGGFRAHRSEEHTSELQSQSNLVCRLLLEKKKHQPTHPPHSPDRAAHPT